MNLAALADRNLEDFGTYEALVYEGRTHTNTELAREAFRLAGALRELGAQSSDRVVVMLPNCPEVGVSYMGALRAGAVVVPVLFLLAPSEVRHILEDSGARVLITSPEFVPNALQAAEELDVEVIVAGGEAEGALAWSELTASQPDSFEPAAREPDDPALLMYTSGTTGKPKGVMLTHRNMLVQAEALHEISGIDREREVGLGVLPQAHAAGLVAAIVSQSYGLRSVLLRWFTPEGFFDAVARYGVTSTALVPAMMVMLLEHPDADRYDLSTLEEVAVGAAPCPIELVQSFQQRFGVRAREVYGLTEAAAVVTANRRSLPVKPGSAGPPIPGVEVRIVDEDGRRLPAGECGEITVRGETVMAGYWNRHDATAEAIRDGWLYTGDVGYLDEDGYLYLVDRAKDLIIRGGQNIYPRDVEEVLQQHPAVAEAAVIGLPDSKYGEEVAACVVAREGTEVAPEEIVAFCRERLAKYKTPKSVHLMPALPHNAVGKVLKGELRQKLAASPPAAPSPLG